MWNSMLNYLQANTTLFFHQILTHLWVSLLSLAIAIAIGVPFGYLASRSPKSEKWITGPFQILRVIPSLALLILLIPVMGTGTVPAVTALSVLAVPPVLLNTIAGFHEVPDFMIETGEGMGMTERDIFRKVRAPLALPLILAGIRTALVEVIASAALAAKIGAGGLGEIIFTGLGLNRADLLILGGLAVGLLSLGCGGLFDLLCRRILRYKYV